VDRGFVGQIVGKGGSHVTLIRSQTGANINTMQATTRSPLVADAEQMIKVSRVVAEGAVCLGYLGCLWFSSVMISKIYEQLWGCYLSKVGPCDKQSIFMWPSRWTEGKQGSDMVRKTGQANFGIFFRLLQVVLLDARLSLFAFQFWQRNAAQCACMCVVFARSCAFL